MKDFLIIGPVPALHYNQTYELLRDRALRIGIWVARFKENPHIACNWLTTLQVNRPEEKKLKLSKTYNPEEYPHYDNYDAIESTSKDIPVDYNGKIGVPMNFFKYYDYLPYEIIDGPLRPKLNGKTKFPRLIIRRKQL